MCIYLSIYLFIYICRADTLSREHQEALTALRSQWETSVHALQTEHDTVTRARKEADIAKDLLVLEHEIALKTLSADLRVSDVCEYVCMFVCMCLPYHYLNTT